MSVSTPILTTSSEIWACAAPPVRATARPAATAAAIDFMVSSPRLLVRGSLEWPLVYGFAERGKVNRRAGTCYQWLKCRRWFYLAPLAGRGRIAKQSG